MVRAITSRPVGPFPSPIREGIPARLPSGERLDHPRPLHVRVLIARVAPPRPDALAAGKGVGPHLIAVRKGAKAQVLAPEGVLLPHLHRLPISSLRPAIGVTAATAGARVTAVGAKALSALPLYAVPRPPYGVAIMARAVIGDIRRAKTKGPALKLRPAVVRPVERAIPGIQGPAVAAHAPILRRLAGLGTSTRIAARPHVAAPALALLALGRPRPA